MPKDCVLQLPQTIIDRLEQIEHLPTRHLVALILHRCRNGKPVPVHSAIVGRLVCQRHYRTYLDAMASFADVVGRDEDYRPRALCTTKPPKCMAWQARPDATKGRYTNARRDLEPTKGVSTLVHGCAVAYPLPGCFEERFRRAFQWYLDVWLPSRGVVDAQARRLVKHYMTFLGFPELEEMQADAFCGDDKQKADDCLRRTEELREDGCQTPVTWDDGGRVYHDLTNLKREVRRRCTLAGEPVVEVDMHASFVAALTAVYAEGIERHRLSMMLELGDFYGIFAEMTGEPFGPDFKQRFLRDVIFGRPWPGCRLWDCFRRLFPNTARRINLDRNLPDPWPRLRIKKGRVRRTTSGQTLISRRLSFVESRIFWKGALTKLHALRVPAIPIHDCLLVRERDAAATKAAIQDAARDVLGFAPAVAVKNWNGEKLAV